MAYDLISSGRGVAYIFVNEQYKNTENSYDNRTGAREEYTKLRKLFKDLSFKVHHFKDLSNASMIKKLEEASADPKLKQRSCLVCVVCCHGLEKTSKSVDGSEEIIHHYLVDKDEKELNTDKIMSIFRNCVALRDKPKLFFIQACRENHDVKRIDCLDHGVMIMEETATSNVNLNPTSKKPATDGKSTDGGATIPPTTEDDNVSDSCSDDDLSDREEIDLTDYFNTRWQKAKEREEMMAARQETQNKMEESKREDDMEGEKTAVMETDAKKRAMNVQPVNVGIQNEEKEERRNEQTKDKGKYDSDDSRDKPSAETDDGDDSRDKPSAETDDGDDSRDKPSAETDDGDDSRDKPSAETDDGDDSRDKPSAETDDGDDSRDKPSAETDARRRTILFPGKKATPKKKPIAVEILQIPCYDDMVVMFASTPGKLAFRCTSVGGVLVTSLCKVVTGYLAQPKGKRLEDTEFLSILTEVLEEPIKSTLKMTINTIDYDVVTQLVIYHKLTKDLYIPIMKPLSWLQKLKEKLKK